MKFRLTSRFAVALVVLLAVLAVTISPTVDIPKTVMRAKQLAQLIFLALLGLAMAFAGVIQPFLESNVLHATDSAPPLFSFSTELSLPLLC